MAKLVAVKVYVHPKDVFKIEREARLAARKVSEWIRMLVIREVTMLETARIADGKGKRT